MMIDGFSSEWDDEYKRRLQLTSWPWSDLVSLINRNCKGVIKTGGVIFELGCGTGPNIPFFQSLGLDYYGVEGSETVVNSLQKKFPELVNNITHGDFTNKLSYSHLPDIDVVVDRAALTHNNLLAINCALENILDALKSGGYFIGIDWFSSKHSDFELGREGRDKNTRINIEKGQFKGLGNVHFSDEKHLRSLFSGFDIISLDEKVIHSYELQKNHKFASWNIVARKR
jgi:SAM-dependent methyltransferase